MPRCCADLPVSTRFPAAPPCAFRTRIPRDIATFSPFVAGILRPMRPLNLLEDAAHLFSARSAISPIFEFAHGYEKYVREFCTEQDPGRLICIHESKVDWPSWESHPAGDELVVVLSGKAEFIQEQDGKETRVILGPHEAIINPPGVWHIANVIEPFIALFITPGPGTTHRPR